MFDLPLQGFKWKDDVREHSKMEIQIASVQEHTQFEEG